MNTHKLTPPRTMPRIRIAPAIFVAIFVGLLLIGIALTSNDFAPGSPNWDGKGTDPCEEYYMARLHWENGDNYAEATRLFQNAAKFNNVEYVKGKEDDFVRRMSKRCE